MKSSPSSINFDFGTVFVGKTSVREFTFTNETTVCQSYRVETDWESGVRTDLKVDPMRVDSLEPNKSRRFRFVYRPFAPDIRANYHLTITRADGAHYRLLLTGKSIGPNVGCSSKNVVFCCNAVGQSERRSVTLTNDSLAPAEFKFNTTGESCSQVEVEPAYGTVAPFSNIRLVFTFTASRRAPLFIKTITCLILHGRPVQFWVMNVPSIRCEMDGRGVDGKRKRTRSDLIDSVVISPDSMVERSGYSGFLQPLHATHIQSHSHNILQPHNTTTATTQHPHRHHDSRRHRQQASLVYLKRQYIRFGPCQVGDALFEEVNLHNECGVQVRVVWEEDRRGVFRIEGGDTIVGTCSSQRIRVTFRPAVKDMLYWAALTGTVLWGGYLAAIDLTLNLFGSSFGGGGSCGDVSWMPQFQLDPPSGVVTLPPCFINSNSYTTFAIRRAGHLPLGFTFQPPSNSRFMMRPMQSLIRGPYEIIAVEFIGESGSTTTRTAHNREVWNIILNGGEVVKELVLEAFVCRRSLIVNYMLDVHFPKTHPDCSQPALVPIRNPTDCLLQFNMEVVEGSDILEIVGSGCGPHQIYGEEKLTSKWVVTPREIGYHKGNVQFTFGQPNTLKGMDTFNVHFTVQCQHGSLTTRPNCLRLGEVPLGSWESEVFEVINDGECSMHLSLACRPCTLSSQMGQVLLQPDHITLLPSHSVQVELCTSPGGMHQQDIEIGCYLRKCSDPKSEVIADSWRRLVRLEVIGVYPTLEVYDIKPSSSTYLTKCQLWQIMSIDRLNSVLSNVRLGSGDGGDGVEVVFPFSGERAASLNIWLLVRNNSTVAMDWRLAQAKTCNCTLVERQFGINLFHMVSVCPHKEQVHITPDIGTLNGFDKVVLEVEVRYTLEGVQKQLFNLEICPQRMPWLKATVPLIFSRATVPLDAYHLQSIHQPNSDSQVNSDGQTTTVFHFRMAPVYIGQIRPMVQAFWLYNGSPERTVHCSVERIVGCGAIVCINPVASIKPMTSHPLLFTVIPYDLNITKARFQLTTQTEVYDLNVECEGSACLRTNRRLDHLDNCRTMPAVSRFPYGVDGDTRGLHLSTSHIVMPQMGLHSTAIAIFYLNNNTDSHMEFRWQRVKLRGVLRVGVEPRKECVGPYECVLLKVRCRAMGAPSLLTLDLVCQCQPLPTLTLETEPPLIQLNDHTTGCAEGVGRWEEERLADYCEHTEWRPVDLIVGGGQQIQQEGRKRRWPRSDAEHPVQYLGLSVTVYANHVSRMRPRTRLTRDTGGQLLMDSLARPRPTSNTFPRSATLATCTLLQTVLWRVVHGPYFERALRSGLPPTFYVELVRDKGFCPPNKHCPRHVTSYLLAMVTSRLVSELIDQLSPPVDDDDDDNDNNNNNNDDDDDDDDVYGNHEDSQPIATDYQPTTTDQTLDQDPNIEIS